MPEYVGLKTKVEIGKVYALDGFGAFHFEPTPPDSTNCDCCAFKDADFPCERFACDADERADGASLYAVKVPGDYVPDEAVRVDSPLMIRGKPVIAHPFPVDTIDARLLPRLQELYAESLELDDKAAALKEEAKECAAAAKNKLAQIYEIISKGQTPEALFEEAARVSKGN